MIVRVSGQSAAVENGFRTTPKPPVKLKTPAIAMYRPAAAGVVPSTDEKYWGPHCWSVLPALPAPE